MTKQKQRRLAHILLIFSAVLAVFTGTLVLHSPRTPGFRAETADFSAFSQNALLDLNTASADELICLPGIGPVKAEAILLRRSELGGFRSTDDLLTVSGIGEATLEKISPYITCEARSTP